MLPVSSSAGMKLKVGGTCRRKEPEKFFCRATSLFVTLQIQLVVLVSAFMVVSTVWSVSCLPFYSWCPRGQQFVKAGGGARAPMFYGVGATAIPQTNMISLSNCGSYLWHKNNTVLLNRPYRVQTAYFPNARHFSTVGLNGKSRCPGYVPSLLSSHVLILMRLEFSLKFWVQKKHKNIIIWW